MKKYWPGQTTVSQKLVGSLDHLQTGVLAREDDGIPETLRQSGGP